MRLIKKEHNAFELGPYLDYLEEIRDRLPAGARDFAFSPGHYEFTDHRCPHDSWVESLSITERGEGKRNESRSLEIRSRFLGAYHDGFFEIVYKGVRSYQLGLNEATRGMCLIGHGDWIVDEILLEPDGFVSHEILFSDSGLWKISCLDIAYFWSNKH